MKETLNSMHRSFIPPTKKEYLEGVDPASALPASYTRPRRILVVDDDEAILNMIQKAGEVLKYNIRFTLTGSISEALSHLDFKDTRCAFDIIILDVVLTNGNGVDLYRKIMSRWPETNVVFLTGYFSEAVRSRVESIGPARIYQKTSLIGLTFFDALLAQMGVKKFGRMSLDR